MVLGLINSALSLFYYLRVVAPMFVPPAGAPPEAPEPIAKWVAAVSAVGSIAVGIGAFALLGGRATLTLSI